MDNFKKIYFGHPVASFNTKEERQLIRHIKEAFPDYKIENPNQPCHDEGYQRYEAKTGNGMDYFLAEVLPYMDAGVFLPFSDGKLGAGVFWEAEFIANAGKPIYEISLERIIIFMAIDVSRRLSAEETNARFYSWP